MTASKASEPTPRTDAAINWDTERTLVAELAKTLERELSAVCSSNISLRAELSALLGENVNLAECYSQAKAELSAATARAATLERELAAARTKADELWNKCMQCAQANKELLARATAAEAVKGEK